MLGTCLTDALSWLTRVYVDVVSPSMGYIANNYHLVETPMTRDTDSFNMLCYRRHTRDNYMKAVAET